MTLVQPDPDLLDVLADLFGAVSAGDDVRSAEYGERLTERMIDTIVEAGLPTVGVALEHGGSGGTAADAAAVLKAAGRSGCPFPLAEQSITGGWLLSSAGLAVPETAFVTAVSASLHTAEGRVSGTVSRVPWLRQIPTVVALADNGANVVLFNASEQNIDRGSSLAGEPRDSIETINAPVLASAPANGASLAELIARAAATRVILMAGACESVLSQAVRYAAERKQFGKPINTFQAVATHLSLIVEETAMVAAAADMATAALGTDRLIDEVATAKIVAGESATKVARSAHQVFGAMGVTAECDLQLLTRRIWTWRDEHGSEAMWARQLGQRIVAAGPDGAWDVLCEPIGGTA